MRFQSMLATTVLVCGIAGLLLAVNVVQTYLNSDAERRMQAHAASAVLATAVASNALEASRQASTIASLVEIPQDAMKSVQVQHARLLEAIGQYAFSNATSEQGQRAKLWLAKLKPCWNAVSMDNTPALPGELATIAWHDYVAVTAEVASEAQNAAQTATSAFAAQQATGRESMAMLGWIINFPGIAILCVVCIWGLSFFHRTMQRVAELTRVVECFAAGNLTTRADDSGQDEISILAKQFNKMAWSIDISQESLRQVIREHDQAMVRAQGMEAQLAAAESLKLESIGRLAAGIAHEINTPTQYVGDNTRFLSDAFSNLDRVLSGGQKLLEAIRTNQPPEPCVAELEAALESADIEFLAQEIPLAIQHSLDGVDRIAKIVRAMKEFSHPDGDEKTPTDINRAIESTVAVSRNEWKYHCEIVLNLDPTLPHVCCRPGILNQAVLNLLINAAHAVEDRVGKSGSKGTVTISTQHSPDVAEIRIADTGVGIPESIRRKIFDPFFTTKEVGRGTGQGLAIVRSAIVDQHGGAIELHSTVGEGTTFIVRLPILGNVLDANQPTEMSELVKC